jgi:hypothetical protein
MRRRGLDLPEHIATGKAGIFEADLIKTLGGQ